MPIENIRLLIAEDQPLIRRALASLFDAEADVEVVAQAGDGAEAVRMARAWSPDVALLDIKMPRLNGIEAARQITQELPGTKVVMLTTFDTDDLVFDAILAGAVGYLLKEAEEREIVATVRDAARGQSRLSPSIARRVLDDFRRIKKPRPAANAEGAGEALTARESLVLDLIVEGKANKDISRALGLAEGTVKNHVSNILSKLHARSRTELAVKALNKPR
jgi:DNA-binding NarL/FixJ family response regulator